MDCNDLKDKLIINHVNNNNNVCCNNYCRIVELVPAIDVNFPRSDSFCDYDTFPETTSYHEDCSITSNDTYISEENLFKYQMPQCFSNK